MTEPTELLRWHNQTDVADWQAFMAVELHEVHTPSPAEIERETERIRERWSPAERRRRRVSPECRWAPPTIPWGEIVEET